MGDARRERGKGDKFDFFVFKKKVPFKPEEGGGKKKKGEEKTGSVRFSFI